MYTCAHCGGTACRDPQHADMPQNCPMRREEFMREVLPEYAKEEQAEFFKIAAAVEAIGYCKWPRLKETAEFCKRMGYTRVGLAFCNGLRREARVVADVLRNYGFAVVSAACKAGGTAKQEAGIADADLVRPGTFEPMCNPIGQAKMLNEQETQFNIVVGLCVGHDSLFYKYSQALATTLIAKDRALANNPAGAVYCADGYLREMLKPS